MQWVSGTTLQDGKYVIEDVLGQGGFGTTYKARHTQINHYVAIKTPNAFLKHDPDYEKYIKSFNKEAKRIAMMAREPHSHLVRFTDYFQEGDSPCLVMEFVDGKTLFEVVQQRGALSEPEVVKLLQEIGGALQWMHDKNLVHRDVSPANIMISREGRSVLIDLGIAQEISPTTRTSTKAGGNSGFAPYEQLMDGVRDVRCDVYSLAATAYFAATGVRPPGSFQRKIEGESLQEPATRVALSGELNRAIVDGMALELEERPDEVAQWLARIEPKPQPGEGTADSPSSTPPIEATISNADFAIVSVLFFLGFVAFAVPLGMVNNLWAVAVAWAVAWAVTEAATEAAAVVAVTAAVAWAVAVAVGAAVAAAVGGTGSMAVAWVVAWAVVVTLAMVVTWSVAMVVTLTDSVAWAVAVAVAMAVVWPVAAAGVFAGTGTGFNLSPADGLLVGSSPLLGGLTAALWPAGKHDYVLLLLIQLFVGGVMMSVWADPGLAKMAVSIVGVIIGGFPQAAFNMGGALFERGYSDHQATFIVSTLITFGLSIGWLLGRFVFS
jgi:Protein kinase domain